MSVAKVGNSVPEGSGPVKNDHTKDVAKGASNTPWRDVLITAVGPPPWATRIFIPISDSLPAIPLCHLIK